jgi:hypothetical protein
MKGTRLAPRDLWQKLRHRGLEMVGRFMRAPGGLVDVELEARSSFATDIASTGNCTGWLDDDQSARAVIEAQPLPWLESHCRLAR